MRNVNAFLKLKFIETNRTLEDLASELNLDKGYLSRVFNNVYEMKKARNINKICASLRINPEIINIYNQDFEDLVSNFFHSVYFIKKNREVLYENLLKYEKEYKNTPYILDIYLVKFVYKVAKKDYDRIYKDVAMKLSSIINSTEKSFQQIYYTYHFASSNFSKQDHNIKKAYNICKSFQFEDENLESIFLYYSFSYFIHSDKPMKSNENYFFCKAMLQKQQNLNRLFNLNILLTGHFQSLGLFEEAIKNDLANLNELEERDPKSSNFGILYNNIAWSYFLLKKYNDAISYYEKTLSFIPVNDIYFSLALCYYKTDQVDKAEKMIIEGKNSECSYSYYYLLLDWLEVFMNKKYCKKSLLLLIKILNKYNNELSPEILELIYNELMDHYSFHKDYEKAFYYSQLLLKNK